MKKNKIISLFVFLVIVLVLNINVVFARFADVTDEETDKQAQEQIKEQEKEHNITEVKSSDNYLLNLQVEGYTLTPDFDKQLLDYTIKEEFNDSEINIKATQSNEKATINGDGIVKIEDGKNEYRVDVTAENGSVRTYIIKLKETTNVKSNETESVNELVETATAEIENKENEKQEKNETNSSNTTMYIIIGSMIVIILLVVFLSKKSKRKGKH